MKMPVPEISAPQNDPYDLYANDYYGGNAGYDRTNFPARTTSMAAAGSHLRGNSVGSPQPGPSSCKQFLDFFFGT